MKRKKSRLKPKADDLATVESQSIAVSLPTPDPETVQKTRFSEAAEKAFSNWMKEVSGTEHEELQSKLLSQAVVATPVIGQEFEFYDCAAAALHGIAPKDELEGMLAVQMVAAHTMAMECLRRAALPNQCKRKSGHKAHAHTSTIPSERRRPGFGLLSFSRPVVLS